MRTSELRGSPVLSRAELWCPHPNTVTEVKVSRRVWSCVCVDVTECWAVIATDDKAFDQRMLHTMATRIGATITEVKASHAVFMTQSKVVADVIEQAARSAVRAAR